MDWRRGFERSIERQVELNQSRTPDERLTALADLLDAPARWRLGTRTRGTGVGGRWRHGNVSGSFGVSDANESLPPNGSTLVRAFEARSRR